MLLNLKHADLYKPEVCLVHFAVQVQFFSFSTTWLPSDLLLHGHCGNNRKNISIHLPTSWQLTQILAILAQMIPSCCSYLDVGCSSRTPDHVKETEKSLNVMFMSTLHMAGMSKTGPVKYHSYVCTPHTRTTSIGQFPPCCVFEEFPAVLDDAVVLPALFSFLLYVS